MSFVVVFEAVKMFWPPWAFYDCMRCTLRHIYTSHLWCWVQCAACYDVTTRWNHRSLIQWMDQHVILPQGGQCIPFAPTQITTFLFACSSFVPSRPPGLVNTAKAKYAVFLSWHSTFNSQLRW